MTFTTIGDAFTIVAIIVAIGFSTWALLMATAFLFGRRAVLAERAVETRPWRSFWVGLLVSQVGGFIALLLLNHPSPILKLVSWLAIIALFAVAGLGATGVALMASRRIESSEPGLSHYGAVNRAVIMIVIACWLPILGWFALVPILMAVSTGAGLSAMLHRERAPATPPTDPSAVRFIP